MGPSEEIRAIPKMRRRFVKRGKFLTTNRRFLKAIQQEVEEWDRAHPLFTIGDRKYPPQNLNESWVETPQPPRLYFAMINVNDAYQSELRAQASELQIDLQDAIYHACMDWSTLLRRLCEAWWPPDKFPNWMGRYGHPALRFFAACLLMNPIQVQPEELIGTEGLSPISLSFDPLDPNAPPLVAFWRTQYEFVMQHLSEAISNGIAITPEWLESIKAGAQESGSSAFDEAHRSGREQTHLFLPLLPGMSTTDLRGLEPIIMSRLRPHYRDGPAREQVLALEAQQYSVKRSAEELGVSRDTVTRRRSPRSG